MEKRTILAIVLSTVVFLGFQALNSVMNPVADVKINTVTEMEIDNTENIVEKVVDSSSFLDIPDDKKYVEEFINFSTELFDVTFNTKGANISSLKLNNFTIHVNKSEKVEMVLSDFENHSFFNITLADKEFQKIFTYKKINSLTHEFSRKFVLKDINGKDSAPLTLTKTYTFLPDDYLFELKITLINSENSLIPMNSDGSLYSLNIGKQIGPSFKKLDRREEYRKFSIFTNGKRDELKVKKSQVSYNDSYTWTAIEGKFFTLAILPENNNPSLYYNSSMFEGKQKSDLTLYRSNLNSSYVEDSYKIYVGPKDKNILDKYNSPETNGWNLSDIKLNKIISFWPLGMFFMWILELMNSIINNYGISIIVLTIIIKIILYPFTKKSIDSMGKMQTIQPEIKKIQEKYKNDSAKLNAATAELYKKEGVNPLGGCLPMLLQMPIFITFYSLFNEFIGLRGSTFIPGWIIDLSKPEYIVQFGFQLPILGWDALRLLPIIYVATQLISMKFSQNNQAGASTGGASAMQTKMMTLGMPIMFFFIMYNQSSGLLLYWITQNIISSAQQIKSKKKSDKEHDLVLEDKNNKRKKKKGRK